MAVDAALHADGSFLDSARNTTRPGIGPLEVLRVALMQGDLDDLRNDLARALRRRDIAPPVLKCLLIGLRGIGINLENARQALALTEQDMAIGCGEIYMDGAGVAVPDTACGAAQHGQWREHTGHSLDLDDTPQSGVRDRHPYIGQHPSSSLQTCDLTLTTTDRPAHRKNHHFLSQQRVLGVAGGIKTTDKENVRTGSSTARTSVDVGHQSKKTARRKRDNVRTWATKR